MYIYIHCNTDNCCAYITGGVNMYLYGSQSINPCVCCVSLYMCVTLSQSTSRKPHYVSDLSKLDTLLHKAHSMGLLVLWYQGSTYVDP